MKKTVCFDEFRQSFNDYDRDYMSYDGYEALYNYLLDIEEDSGIEMELDPIAIICDFAEYDSIEDVKKNYNVEDFEDLQEHTWCVELNNGHILMQRY